MTTEKELAEALKKEQDEIVVEYDLAKKVVRIKAMGKVAWGACIVALGIAVASVITTLGTAGTSGPITVPSTVVSYGIAGATMGTSTATTAVAIAVAGGGIGVLNKLRKYRMEKVSEDKIILHRK